MNSTFVFLNTFDVKFFLGGGMRIKTLYSRIANLAMKLRRRLLRVVWKNINRRDYKVKSECWPLRVELSNDTNEFSLFCMNKKISNIFSASRLRNSSGEFVIVGSGPSINSVDFIALKKREFILLNDAIDLIHLHDLRPYCCIIIDSNFVENRFCIIQKIPRGTRLLTTLGCLRAIYERDGSLIKKLDIYLTQEVINPIYSIDFNYKKKAILNGFSENIGIGYIDGGTVMAVAIQLTFQLSATNVFLLGFDIGNANQPRFNEAENKNQKSGLIKDYEEKTFPFMCRVKDIFLNKKIDIYNCSSITILPYEVIPHLDVRFLYEK